MQSLIFTILLLFVLTDQMSFTQADFTVLKAFTQQRGKNQRVEIKLFPERTLIFSFYNNKYGDEEITIIEKMQEYEKALFTVCKTVHKHQVAQFSTTLFECNDKEAKDIFSTVLIYMIAPINN